MLQIFLRRPRPNLTIINANVDSNGTTTYSKKDKEKDEGGNKKRNRSVSRAGDDDENSSAAPAKRARGWPKKDESATKGRDSSSAKTQKPAKKHVARGLEDEDDYVEEDGGGSSDEETYAAKGQETKKKDRREISAARPSKHVQNTDGIEDGEEEEENGIGTHASRNKPTREATSRKSKVQPRKETQPVASASSHRSAKPPPGATVRTKIASGKRRQEDHEDEEEEEEIEVPEGTYDSLWNEDDEVLLRSWWTREHDIILDNMQDHEASLWKKTYNIFGVPPPELIPPHITVDTSEKEGIPDPGNENLGEGEVLVNTNWGSDVCNNFLRVVCCPAFTGRPDYVRYVLSYVLHLRIGAPEGFPRPYRKDYLDTGRVRLSEGVLKLSKGMVEGEALLEAMEKVLGPNDPPHCRFLEILKSYVKREQDGTKALVQRDFKAIVHAWDNYVNEPNSPWGLRTMEEYVKAWNKKHQKSVSKPKAPGEKHNTNAVKRLKKEYMISQWRETCKKQRQQRAKSKGKQKRV